MSPANNIGSIFKVICMKCDIDTSRDYCVGGYDINKLLEYSTMLLLDDSVSLPKTTIKIMKDIQETLQGMRTSPEIRNVIIEGMNTKTVAKLVYLYTMHKFGIDVSNRSSKAEKKDDEIFTEIFGY